MPTLYLMRHAKSDWHSAAQSDFERPLNLRGGKDAIRMGQWFEAQGLRPHLLLASSAQRARQTMLAVVDILGVKEDEVEFNKDLYLAGRSTLVNVLRAVSGSAESVLLVAHNPGMDELVEWLALETPPLSESGKLMTTAAIAIFSLSGDWASLKPGSASLKQLVRPRELS
jgi:phosphohistidine phosphatase